MESETHDTGQVEALLAFADALPSPTLPHPPNSVVQRTQTNNSLRLRRQKWIKRHGLSASADFVVIVKLDSCLLAKEYEQWLLHSLLCMRDYALQDTQDRPSRTFRVLFGPCSCRGGWEKKPCSHSGNEMNPPHVVRAIVHLEPRPGYVVSEDQLTIVIDRPPLSYHTHASSPLSMELAKFLPDLILPTPDFVQQLGLSAVSAYTAHHVWCEIRNTLAPQSALLWQYKHAKWHSVPIDETVRFAHWNYPIQRMPTPTYYIPDPFVPRIEPPTLIKTNGMQQSNEIKGDPVTEIDIELGIVQGN